MKVFYIILAVLIIGTIIFFVVKSKKQVTEQKKATTVRPYTPKAVTETPDANTGIGEQQV